jgi:hypothetical protein
VALEFAQLRGGQGAPERDPLVRHTEIAARAMGFRAVTCGARAEADSLGLHVLPIVYSSSMARRNETGPEWSNLRLSQTCCSER